MTDSIPPNARVRWILALLCWFLAATAWVGMLVGLIDLAFDRSATGQQLLQGGGLAAVVLTVLTFALKPGLPREGSRLFTIAFGWWPFAAFGFFLVWRIGVSGEQLVACEAGDGDSCWRLAERRERRDRAPEARAIFETGCALDHTRCCTALGSMREYGRGGEPDLPGALAAYEQACNGGEALACLRLGSMLKAGRGSAADPVRAATFFERACAAGSPSGCEELRLVQPPSP
jgi:hypothetical protein